MINPVELYGEPTIVIPVTSEFEVDNYNQTVKGKKAIRLLSWPSTTNGLLTFGPLTAVTFLDLHGLGICALPSEIGLLKELEYLDIRNNSLFYLPPELSECLKIKTLLYSGNQLFYSSQIQLFSLLRQLNQNQEIPLSLKWSFPSGMFNVLSWNVIPQSDAIQPNFPRVPARFLDWSYRSELIIHSIVFLKPSLFCIQDIEPKQLDFIMDRFRTLGYGCASSFASRPRKPGIPPIGVATFFLRSKFTQDKFISYSYADLPPVDGITKLQLMANDSAFQLLILRLQTQSICLVNVGLHRNKYEKEVLLGQVKILMNRISTITSQTLIVGSFDCDKKSEAYHHVFTAMKKDGTNFTNEVKFHDVLDQEEKNVGYTVWTDDGFSNTDYIFATHSLVTTAILDTPSKVDAEKSYHMVPNSQWPSNHIPIGASFDIHISSGDSY